MIKQDYIIRMIQEVISAIAEVLLKRKKLDVNDKQEYDSIAKQVLGVNLNELATIDITEFINKYSDMEDGMDKLEFIAVSLLIMSEEENKNLILKSKLRQDGSYLLKYIQENGYNYSIQREALIKMLSTNN